MILVCTIIWGYECMGFMINRSPFLFGIRIGLDGVAGLLRLGKMYF